MDLSQGTVFFLSVGVAAVIKLFIFTKSLYLSSILMDMDSLSGYRFNSTKPLRDGAICVFPIEKNQSEDRGQSFCA